MDDTLIDLGPAKLFDGVVSDPIPVDAHLRSGNLLLRMPSGQVLVFPLRQCGSPEPITPGFRLTILPLEAGASEGMVEFPDRRVGMREIEQAMGDTRVGLSSLWYRFAQISTLRKVLIGLAATACVFGCVYLAFVNVYRIVPLRYDHHLGDRMHSQFISVFDTCRTSELDLFLADAQTALSSPKDRFAHPIQVINHPMQNAFAIPGGRIYLFRGLLESSHNPDEILGVLAHEWAHAEKRHSVQQLSRTIGTGFLTSLTIGSAMEGFDMLDKVEILAEIGNTLLVLKYSRDFETEADAEAMWRLMQAGLPTSGLDSLLVRLERESGGSKLPSILSTHPASQERAIALARVAPTSPTSPDTLFRFERLHWKSVSHSCPDAIKDTNSWNFKF